MTPDKYTALNGQEVAYDLDDVVRVVKGYSRIRQGWPSLIVYDGAARSLVELRSSPPDYKGNSAEEAEEVTEQYVRDSFQIEPDQLRQLRAAPRDWQMLNRRG